MYRIITIQPSSYLTVKVCRQSHLKWLIEDSIQYHEVVVNILSI